MSQSMFSLQRVLSTAGVALALSAAAALPAAAQQAQQAEQQSEQQAVTSADSQTVTRDAETGKLRAATPAEQANLHALKAKSLARVASPQVQQKVHSSGARGARLNDEFLTSAIAVRAADGKIVVAHSAEEAAAKAEARVATTPATE